MGWLSGGDTKKSNPNSNPNTDPLRDLDPSLRDFLETESPHTPPPLPSSPSPPQSVSPSSDPPPGESFAASTTASASIPTLYPDGRYADLWSTYRPLSVIEDTNKTDQEKLLDVLEGYKQRKKEISRAALENCAFEQGDINECYKSGSWMKRMMLCREENRAFERCYLMQSRFLKALGYLSASRPASVDEQIQMHADTLYHRMLAQEAAINAAKATNAPIPTFPPIISPSSSSPAPTPTPSPPPSIKPEPPETFSKDQLTPAAREALQARLKDLSPEEREIEERATAMEASHTEVVGRTVKSILGESERKRRERREKGEAGVGDIISSWFGR